MLTIAHVCLAAPNPYAGGPIKGGVCVLIHHQCTIRQRAEGCGCSKDQSCSCRWAVAAATMSATVGAGSAAAHCDRGACAAAATAAVERFVLLLRRCDTYYVS
jgi:hypothetical protein